MTALLPASQTGESNEHTFRIASTVIGQPTQHLRIKYRLFSPAYSFRREISLVPALDISKLPESLWGPHVSAMLIPVQCLKTSDQLNES